MKRYSITRDSEIEEVFIDATDQGTGYRLRHLPFHSATGFEFDVSRPGSMDLAIAIMADWLGEHPTEDTVHTQFWECLALAGEVHVYVLTHGNGKTCLILGNEIQEFMAGRVRDIMKFEPSIEAITCDGC